jgi:hypothetical protein
LFCEGNEALEREFKAEVEEEEDDTDLGEVLHGLDIHDEAHAVRADDGTGDEEA